MSPEERGSPELAAFIAELRTRLGAEAVTLFGSRARGEHLPDSDYDLAVVSPAFRGLNRLARWTELYEVWDASGPDADADIFGLTPAELLAMENPSLWDMLQDGRPLFDTGVWAAAQVEFDWRKAAGYIIPIEGGWRIGQGPGNGAKG